MAIVNFRISAFTEPYLRGDIILTFLYLSSKGNRHNSIEPVVISESRLYLMAGIRTVTFKTHAHEDWISICNKTSLQMDHQKIDSSSILQTRVELPSAVMTFFLLCSTAAGACTYHAAWVKQHTFAAAHLCRPASCFCAPWSHTDELETCCHSNWCHPMPSPHGKVVQCGYVLCVLGNENKLPSIKDWLATSSIQWNSEKTLKEV